MLVLESACHINVLLTFFLLAFGSGDGSVKSQSPLKMSYRIVVFLNVSVTCRNRIVTTSLLTTSAISFLVEFESFLKVLDS